MIGPKALPAEVLRGIVGGAQHDDSQKIDEQTAIGMTAGAEEASHGAPPDAPSPGTAEGARGAAAEAKAAPDAGLDAKDAKSQIDPTGADANAAGRVMAGEAASQAARAPVEAKTGNQGGGEEVVDQPPNNSQFSPVISADIQPAADDSRIADAEQRAVDLWVGQESSMAFPSWQAIHDDVDQRIKEARDSAEKVFDELKMGDHWRPQEGPNMMKGLYDLRLSWENKDDTKHKMDDFSLRRLLHDENPDPAHGRVSAQQPVTSIGEEGMVHLSYHEFLLESQQHYLSDLKSSADEMRAAAEGVLALEKALRAAGDSRELETPHVRYAEAVLAKVKGSDWREAVDVAKDDKAAIEGFFGDRSGAQIKAMQTLQGAVFQHAAARLGLDAVESELDKTKGTESDAKEHDDHPNENQVKEHVGPNGAEDNDAGKPLEAAEQAAARVASSLQDALTTAFSVLHGQGLRGFSEERTMDSLAGSQDQDQDTSNKAYHRFHSEIAQVKWAMQELLYKGGCHYGTDRDDVKKFLREHIHHESDQFTAEAKSWLDHHYFTNADKKAAERVMAAYRSIEIGLDDYIKAYRHMDSERTLEKFPVPADPPPPPTPLDHASKPEPKYHPEVLAKMAEEKLAAEKKAAEEKKLAAAKSRKS